jgi:DNA-binding NarL/FixJ family response regulator
MIPPVSTESTAAKSLRLLVVDGHAGFLQAALRTISQDKRIGGVMSAQSGHEAIERAAAWTPDLVVMDITLPDGEGLEAAQAIKTVASAACVVLMTVDKSDAYSQAAVAAGLDGVIDKGDFSAQLRGVVDRLCATILLDR